MKVRVVQALWGGRDLRYHVRLYEMTDGEDVRYRINIDDEATAKFARMEFEGNGAKDTAQKEYDEIVYGDKTPLQYAWM